MKRSLTAAIGLISLAALGVLARANSAAACSMDPRPGARMPGVSSLIVLPTNRIASAARGLPPDLAAVPPLRGYDESVWRPGMRSWWEARVTRWFKRLRDRPPYGQLAKLERVEGPDSARIVAAMDAAAGEVVLVHWDLDSMCRPALRRERASSLAVGERVFLTATLRETTGWVQGRPTFDVTPHHFVHYEREYWQPPTERDRARMTAREVMTVYAALPHLDQLRWQPDTGGALASLREWARSHPALATRDPASRMIENAQTMAARYLADWRRIEARP